SRATRSVARSTERGAVTEAGTRKPDARGLAPRSVHRVAGAAWAGAQTQAALAHVHPYPRRKLDALAEPIAHAGPPPRSVSDVETWAAAQGDSSIQTRSVRSTQGWRS